MLIVFWKYIFIKDNTFLEDSSTLTIGSRSDHFAAIAIVAATADIHCRQ